MNKKILFLWVSFLQICSLVAFTPVQQLGLDTALLLAVQEGDYQLTSLLIGGGAQINRNVAEFSKSSDFIAGNPLMIASKRYVDTKDSIYLELIKLLMKSYDEESYKGVDITDRINDNPEIDTAINSGKAERSSGRVASMISPTEQLKQAYEVATQAYKNIMNNKKLKNKKTVQAKNYKKIIELLIDAGVGSGDFFTKGFGRYAR